jgi:hypothetical protein
VRWKGGCCPFQGLQLSGAHSIRPAAWLLWLRVEGQLAPALDFTIPLPSFLPRPLHIAARNGLASVVQALLSRGATVLAVDEEGGWGLGSGTFFRR